MELPPIYLLPTNLLPEQLHQLENSIPSLTYDVREASLVLGKITRRARALFELRRLKLPTEAIDGGGSLGSNVSQAACDSADGPAKKKRKLQTNQDASNRELDQSTQTDTDAPATNDGHGHAARPAESLIDDGINVVRVLNLSWLEDSLDKGEALPYEKYLLYAGRKLPMEANNATRTSSASPQTKTQQTLYEEKPSSSVAKGILERAAADMPPRHSRTSVEARKKWTSPGTTTSQRPPPLLRETSSEHGGPLPPIPAELQSLFACERRTPSDTPNAGFVQELKKIRTLRLLKGDEVGVRAYSTSIASLSAYPYEIKSQQEIARLPGCGARIAELHQTWKDHGQTRETTEAAGDAEMTSLKLFYDIWGVGDKTAREFYRKGWRDLDDVVEYGWSSLSRVQQIGVKYYDDFLVKIPRAEVEDIATTILQHAREAVDGGVEMTIVGGYRRGSAQSGDVDVVLSHREETHTLHMVEKVVGALEASGFVSHTLLLSTHNSEREQAPLPWRGAGAGRRRDTKPMGTGFDTLDKALVVWQRTGPGGEETPPPPKRRVDIIVSPWKTVGCALVGWSGGTTFQRDLRRYCTKVRGFKFDSSGVRRRSDGAWMDFESAQGAQDDEETGQDDKGGRNSDEQQRGHRRQRRPAPDMDTAERRVFAGLGLTYRPPQERCTG